LSIYAPGGRYPCTIHGAWKPCYLVHPCTIHVHEGWYPCTIHGAWKSRPYLLLYDPCPMEVEYLVQSMVHGNHVPIYCCTIMVHVIALYFQAKFHSFALTHTLVTFYFKALRVYLCLACPLTVCNIVRAYRTRIPRKQDQLDFESLASGTSSRPRASFPWWPPSINRRAVSRFCWLAVDNSRHHARVRRTRWHLIVTTSLTSSHTGATLSMRIAACSCFSFSLLMSHFPRFYMILLFFIF